MNKTLTKGVAKAIEEEVIKTFEKGTMSWLKTKPYIKVLQEPAAMGFCSEETFEKEWT